jgi:hypothetical protein
LSHHCNTYFSIFSAATPDGAEPANENKLQQSVTQLQAEDARARRASFTDKQKERNRLMSKLRKRRMRERRKKALEEATDKTLTRREREEMKRIREDQRKSWREAKRAYRKKKKQSQEQAENYHQPSVDDAVSEKDNDAVSENGYDVPGSISRTVIRSAKRRVKNALPRNPEVLALVMKEVLSEMSPNKKKALNDVNVLSPSTVTRKNACEKVVERLAEEEKDLRQKRNTEAKAKRNLIIDFLTSKGENHSLDDKIVSSSK